MVIKLGLVIHIVDNTYILYLRNLYSYLKNIINNSQLKSYLA